jgi:uncharacterized protein YyaL (SSP411 family)
MRHTNALINESSPYLLQHAHNPVDWFPWGEAAFEKARTEGKPVFLSIGYSACHWCHVMEAESFEDETVAEALNRSFISVKVDREARPDIDNIYMRACQAFTGRGGWPTSIFMTPDQKPFFAGTYFPKDDFLRLLAAVADMWAADRQTLTRKGDEITAFLNKQSGAAGTAGNRLDGEAVAAFRSAFDPEFGGFGPAPKFPAAHNLMFLCHTAPEMADKTLRGMFAGGIFDHIGFGFSRYSTDRFWLVPHFEKMLYDNALLAMAYLLAYEAACGALYAEVAKKTLLYMRRELESPEGGFFSAQDADSGGAEGEYYLFTPGEITAVLGESDGRKFNTCFGITEAGNFEGKNIPNLIGRDGSCAGMDALLPRLYEYRRARHALCLDNKRLTAWNGLAIAAFADAYRILGEEEYLSAARKTADFIERELADGDELYADITGGKRGSAGFLDDYAFYIFALLRLHQAGRDEACLVRAAELARKTVRDYFDDAEGGFFFSGRSNEKLIANPRETYDGAMPSGNSVMAFNLSRLAALTGSADFYALSEKQNAFMDGAASVYPAGHAFYLYSRLPVKEVVCVPANREDLRKIRVRSNWIFRVTDTPEFPILNGKTTFYVCEAGACLPPSNEPPGA